MKKIPLFLFVLFIVGPLMAQATRTNQPIKNFEALWSEFDQRYANFTLKKVDWQAVYNQYQPQINEQTTDQELFEICCAMLQELRDGHVTIDPGFEDTDIECGPPYTFTLEEAFPEEQDWRAFQEVMESTFQNAGFSAAKRIEVTEETNFQYRSAEQFSYLRLDEMTELFILRKLNKALNQAFAAFRDKNGLIIDLRFNGGGYDRASLQIAGRLVKDKKLSHTKFRRNKGENTFSKGQQVYLKPKGKKPFTKPVVILISDYTASAAEVFLLAVKDLPQVTIIGEHSEGIFSDMYEFELPNKWEVSLSDMQFIAKDGLNYEGEGVAPNYQIVNSKADLKNQIDPVLVKALEVLKEK